MLRQQRAGDAPKAASGAPSPARNLLIVDDEKALLLTLSYGLRKRDPSLNIMTADNGLNACRLLDTCRVDLVVTDLHMPGMDGFELIEYLSDHQPETPVLAMTGAQMRDVEGRLASLGVTRCLEKSVDFHRLLDSILRAADNCGRQVATA